VGDPIFAPDVATQKRADRTERAQRSHNAALLKTLCGGEAAQLSAPIQPTRTLATVNEAELHWSMTPDAPDERLRLEAFLGRPEWHQRAACRGGRPV
jgi:hypothetical protein